MTASKSTQSEKPNVLGYFHTFLVMLSGLFLVTMAATTIIILHYSPENEYIAIKLDLTSRLTSLVYLSLGLVLIGLLELVVLVVLLLRCHESQKQRTFVSISCLATALLSMGILVLFASQPEAIVEQTLPENDVIYEPVNESFTVAMEKYGYPGNEELTQSLQKLQMDKECCLFQDPEGYCIIITGEGHILRPTTSCIQYLYDYYFDWLEKTGETIQIMAIIFCVILGIAILVNIYLLISVDRGSYMVEKRRKRGTYRRNISSFTYVPFQTDVPVKEGSQNQTVDPDVFWITKNDVLSIDASNPSICVMHDY